LEGEPFVIIYREAKLIIAKVMPSSSYQKHGLGFCNSTIAAVIRASTCKYLLNTLIPAMNPSTLG